MAHAKQGKKQATRRDKAAEPSKQAAKRGKAVAADQAAERAKRAAGKAEKTAAEAKNAKVGKAANVAHTAKVGKAEKTPKVATTAKVGKAEKTAAVTTTAKVGKAEKTAAVTTTAKVGKTEKTTESAKAAESAKGRVKAAEPAKGRAKFAKAAESAEPAKSTDLAQDDGARAETAKRLEAEARQAKAELKSAKSAAKAVLKAEDRELEPAQAKKLVEQVAAQIIAAEAASAEQVAPEVGLAELLRLEPGAAVDLAGLDTRATPGVQTRAQAEAQLPVLAERVSELQERLYAAAVGGGSARRVLLVLQGMDTSGKGGTVRHVVGLLDPNGTRIKAFKAPTPEEREHDFLWRIRANAPVAGQVGIFDRSHYEDVLVARVRKLALPMHIGRRYNSINRFEKSLVDDGCVVLKCFLHISADEQRERLLARLENPDKNWKYNPKDVDDRLLWPDFQEAYRIALERCGTETAPWHVVPADRKWYRNYAVLRLLIEALESIDPQYPPADYDLEQERARVLGS